MDKRWTEEGMEHYRHQGDPDVDQLVEEVLPKDGSESVGRLGYNDMLLLADQLMKTPELAFVEKSRLAEQLNNKPISLRNYFDPMVAPDWIEPEKLELGSKIWRDNTLATLGVLYSGSLPACYLIKNGIPALYKTDKLRDAKYIFQRIYETGLMLADTMDANGISVIEDIDYDDDKLLVKALQNLDKGSHWEHQGRTARRRTGDESAQLDTQQVAQEIERLRGKPTRYLWGKGYITAKKVRFLHASMRYMLTHPGSCCPYGDKEDPKTLSEVLSQRQEPWDEDKFGSPINQEDLAYTLMTFGLVIPRGLARWGVPISSEQAEAFLHLWKVIGYIMGIDANLLPDNWQQAEELFTIIKKRQIGYSEDGVILTEALMGFLGDYLPHVPGFANRLSTALIINQLGEKEASYIIPETELRQTNRWWRRPIYKIAGGVFRIYFMLRSQFAKRFRLVGGMTANCINEASMHLIESWRGAYIRQPFFVPINATTWIRKPGVNEEYLNRLKHWRRRLFVAMGVSLALLGTSVFSLAIALPCWIFAGQPALITCLVLTASTWLSAMALMNFWLPVIFDARPKLDASV